MQLFETSLHRVAIWGPPGSGKTTLAKDLAKILGYQVFHSDNLYIKSNWKQLRPESLRNKAIPLLRAEKWIIDGNFGELRDEVLEHATLVIILNPPLLILLIRIFKRTLLSVTNGFKILRLFPPQIAVVTSGLTEIIPNIFIELIIISWRFKRKTFNYLYNKATNKLRKNSVLVLRRVKDVKDFLDNINTFFKDSSKNLLV